MYGAYTVKYAVYALFLPIFKEEGSILDYIIRNHKNIYIRLDEKGRPVSCTESNKGLFEYHKAKNICDSLPKGLKKLKFQVEDIPDIKPKDETVVEEKGVLSNCDYEPTENITRWADKFGTCGEILSEAETREQELIQELYKADQELLDLLHIIEIEKPKDLFGGWQLYKRIRNNRKERRYIKDELLIIEDVLEKIKDIPFLHRERVQKAIDGLFTRKYKFRIVEEEDVDAM